jgi:Protein of unknown function (DUF5818)
MRKTCIITALLALSSLVCAQDSQKLPGEILGPPLVAWSAVQQPRPIPATSSSAENGASDICAVQPQTGQADSAPPQSSIQTFTGTVANDGGRYLLKVSENAAYQLDDQEKLRSCEGRQVRIAGKLDAKNGVLYIANIAFLS